MIVKNVGVIGCGLMGSGIIQVSAQAGYSVLFVEANDELVKRGLGRLKDTLEGLAAKGKIEAKAKDDTLGRIAGTTRLDDLKACDLVIEAMTENQALKNETFAKLDRIAAPHAILASNTSSCNVTALAAATKRPGQVVGMHFFNPVPLMKLVEIVRTLLTDEAAVRTATEFVRSVGKVPVQAKDATAFIVNRLLVPYLLDAIRVYEGGLASLEDIDQAMKLGCGYPMGPFTLLDLVGLDTRMYVAAVMFEEFREPRYAPPRPARNWRSRSCFSASSMRAPHCTSCWSARISASWASPRATACRASRPAARSPGVRNASCTDGAARSTASSQR